MECLRFFKLGLEMRCRRFFGIVVYIVLCFVEYINSKYVYFYGLCKILLSLY